MTTVADRLIAIFNIEDGDARKQALLSDPEAVELGAQIAEQILDEKGGYRTNFNAKTYELKFGPNEIHILLARRTTLVYINREAFDDQFHIRRDVRMRSVVKVLRMVMERTIELVEIYFGHENDEIVPENVKPVLKFVHENGGLEKWAADFRAAVESWAKPQ